MANKKISELPVLSTAKGTVQIPVNDSGVTKNVLWSILRANASSTAEANTLASLILTGAGAPASTPTMEGQMYVDLTNDVIYFACGTASSADWKRKIVVTTGAGAPGSTPLKEGDIYIDTTADVPYIATGTVSSANWTALIPITTSSIKEITASYAILDNDGYETIIATHGAATYMMTVTLPTLADNKGRCINVYNVNTGMVKIDGENAETINGLGEYYLFADGDSISVVATTAGWRILSYKGEINTGWINRSDWTNVHIGTMNIPTDNDSGAALLIGELITEETSGNTARIIKVEASNLIVYACTGTGYFTNNKRVTGGVAGGFRLVNTGTTTKNIDYNFYHLFGVNLYQLDCKMLLSSDGTNNNSYNPNKGGVGDTGGTVYGWDFMQVDSDEVKIQTGSGGIEIIIDAGTAQGIDSEDIYYNAIVRRII